MKNYILIQNTLISNCFEIIQPCDFEITITDLDQKAIYELLFEFHEYT